MGGFDTILLRTKEAKNICQREGHSPNQDGAKLKSRPRKRRRVVRKVAERGPRRRATKRRKGKKKRAYKDKVEKKANIDNGFRMEVRGPKQGVGRPACHA